MEAENRAVQELIEEVRRLHNRLRWVGDHLHEHEKVTTAMRSLLFSLKREGPCTVPDLARERLVSRQIIQTQINYLLELDLVKTEENPQHRRSKLMVLTPKGVSLVDSMICKEQEVLEKQGSPLTVQEIESASGALRTLRHHLENIESLL